jgi:hypothetical protein
MPYRLTLEMHPRYLHACATGTHNAANVARMLHEVNDACVRQGITAVLLEMNFSGPSLATGSIFSLVSQGSAAAKSLRKIAYVDSSRRDFEKKKFAETVAVNRGANVRLFPGVEEAARWLAE